MITAMVDTNSNKMNVTMRIMERAVRSESTDD